MLVHVYIIVLTENVWPRCTGLLYEENGLTSLVIERSGRYLEPSGGWLSKGRKYYVHSEMYAEEKRRKISVQLDQSEIMDYASGNPSVYRLNSSKNNVLISCSSDYCCSWVYQRLSLSDR